MKLLQIKKKIARKVITKLMPVDIMVGTLRLQRNMFLGGAFTLTVSDPVQATHF